MEKNSCEHHVVAIGEILWDVFQDGTRFGGAPVNLLSHAAALGAKTSMLGQVGNDELGHQAIAKMNERGIGVQAVLTSESYPTGTAEVNTRGEGPSYIFPADAAWDYLPNIPLFADLAAEADALAFGTLGQRAETSRATISAVVEAAPKNCLRFYDVNLRPPHDDADRVRASLQLCDVLKVNGEELEHVCDLLNITSSTVSGQCEEIAAALKLKAMILTRGQSGALMWRAGETCEAPARKVEVVNTVGAGDAFGGTALLGLLRDWPLQRILDVASEASAFVCSKADAAPLLPDSIRRQFH